MRHLNLILAAALISTFAATAAFADTVIYLVRHAEKQSDGTHDPALTELGTQRAQAIADKLASAGLKMVYSTDYKRTQETAAPTAKMAGLDIQSYDPRALKEFAAKLQQSTTPTLVVGHSNTTPVLANFVAGTEYPLLEDHQYDYLYVVTLKEDGTASVAIDYIEPRTP